MHRKQSDQPVRNLSLRKKLVFSAIATVMALLLLEGLLRFTGAGQPPVIGTLRFGYDTGIPRFDEDGIEQEGQPYRDMPLFEADPVLFWKPIANTPFTGVDGLRLPAPATKTKPDGSLRVAVVGDSCSFLGSKLYLERFAEKVQKETGKLVEVVNASCPGYTAFQGQRRLEQVWAWQPDLVVIYFGWNDHWNSLSGRTDAELASLQVAEPFLSQARHLHLYWALANVWGSSSRADHVRTVRVPLPLYKKSLEEMAAAARQHHCRVVLVTAPTAFEQHRLPAWVGPFFQQFYEMTPGEVQSIPVVHEQYNEVVRDVAARQELLLVDLARSWTPGSVDERFRTDGIHLTEVGHQDAAAALYEVWASATRERSEE